MKLRLDVKLWHFFRLIYLASSHRKMFCNLFSPFRPRISHLDGGLPVQGVGHEAPGVDEDGALYPGHGGQLLLVQPPPGLGEGAPLVRRLDAPVILVGLKTLQLSTTSQDALY